MSVRNHLRKSLGSVVGLLIQLCRSALLQFLFLCFAATAGFAQYRYDHWTADNGLPQNIITDLHQTKDGYLWVATLDGLARFDGVRFTTFDKSNSPGIKTNRFTTLYEDEQGDFWLGTESSGVTRYNHKVFATYGPEHGLPSSGTIRGFTKDETGQLLVWSDDWIRQWRPADEHFVEVAAPHFPGGYHKSTWENRSDIWGLDQTGLHHFVRGRWQSYAVPAAFRNLNDYFVSQTQDGVIWLRDTNGRVVQVADNKAVEPDSSASSDHARQGSPLIYQDRQGRPWEINLDRNLGRYLLLPSSGHIEQVAFSILFEDREGHMWLGTDGQGLYRVRKQVITTLSEAHGLVGRNVYSVYEDHTGAVWIGAWSGGLSRFQEGRFTNYTTRDGLADGPLMALREDREGRLWVSIHYRLQLLSNGKFTTLSGFLPDHTGANAIYQDRAGTIWIGTDRGLIRYCDGKITLITTQDGLVSNNVRAIIESPSGYLWIGCYGGLTRFRENRFTSWTERDGLPSNMVRALYEDSDGTLWIGTYDGGLGRFKDGKFTRYTMRDGLFNNGAFQILEDSTGHLWMSCNHGIYRVRKEELNDFAAGRLSAITSIGYGQSDGMLNVECNGGLSPAGARTRDGKLWFPTQDGVAIVDPATITTNPEPPPVVIEDLRIDNQAVTREGKDGVIEVRPGQENIEIQYTAPSLINSEHIKFKYMLSGLDHDWVDVGARRTAYYPHVPPGHYVFRVIAANSDGVWNMEGKSVHIRVLPPFYRTWWFGTLCVLMVLGLLFAAFKYRVNQLEERQAAQQAFSQQLIESQEAERKRIATELHDSLGQNLLIIKNRALLQATKLPDEQARAPFNELSDAVSHTLEEVRTISYHLRPPHLDQLGLRMALVAMIEKVAASSPIRFTHDLDECDGRFAAGDDITLYRIVQEGLNNILKHSGATEAHLKLRIEKHQALLTMRDNGRGFTNDSQAHVGLGLQGIAERARILGGTQTIQSSPGQGTIVTVRIDLKG